MTRKISNAGVKLIKSFEGCKLTAYKPVPTEQYWTIGWGHYGSDVKQGMTITQAQADAMLIADLAKYEAYVNNPSFVPVTDKLTQNQFDALTSFCYNTGPENLKKLCKDRTIAQIAASITNYNKAGGKVLNGLVRRRKAELDLYNTPDIPKIELEDKITVIVNGKQIEGAFMINNTVLIPLRAAGENISGSKIDWNQKTKTATLTTPQ